MNKNYCMRQLIFISALLFSVTTGNAQLTRFEKTGGKESAPYFEAIEWYKALDKKSAQVSMQAVGMTDAGYPLHLVLVSNDGRFNPGQWHRDGKVVIMINNGIHPGEPDGIDASMMLVRDITDKKIKLPGNVVLGLIPVYNIGGALNRNRYSRANQNGPLEYGFRGNAQNLDLNRDFTKNDSKDARAFAEIFHLLDPDLLVDNHVSDGADYQHTMTLLTTQYNKLGEHLGAWLKNIYEPAVYKGMAGKKWDLIPYVDFEYSSPDKGMRMFYDPPRYSSGYAALFQTVAFMPETHMLKPYDQRVRSTYALMQTMIEQASVNATGLIAARKKERAAVAAAASLPFTWTSDTATNSSIVFKGYEQAFKPSDATGLNRMYYDRSKPYTKNVRFFDVFKPSNFVNVPAAYIIPQGWYSVLDILILNKVSMRRFTADTTIEVEAYHIDDYKPAPRPYEKHHKNSAVKVSVMKQKIKFLKGDYYIPLDQPAKRYLVEMLEPTGDDSFFAWNFFDGILQQKEGYSDYRWDDLAAEVLKNDPELKKKLEEKKAADPKFAANSSAQLDFIYKNSPWYEPAHNRYPVYRLAM